MKTNYSSIYRDKMNTVKKEKIFSALESIGYTTILKSCLVGAKNESNVWVAVKDQESIVYNEGCFSKYIVDCYDYFTEEEYNTIKEAYCG